MILFNLKKWAIERIRELPTKLAQHWLVSIITALVLGLAGWVGVTTVHSTISLTSALQDDKSWHDASDAVSNFYRYWNLHRYDAAYAQLIPQYAGKMPNYSVEKMNEFALKIKGGITVSQLQPIEAESKENVKVYEYTTDYILREDSAHHGERLRAYVVHRDDKWTIDTIQVQSFR